VPVSQFGERQYELAANLELLTGNGAFFTPTTSVEEHLGVDVAMTPGDPRIWRLLGISPPRGVVAGSGSFRYWPKSAPAAATPPFLVSLFIQYKRMTHLTRSTATEWGTHHGPYWRLELSRRQHHRLQVLEAAVGHEAVVRYAAPKFWRHEDMWQLQGAGAVLDHSLFVVPTHVSQRHTRLTWSAPIGLVGHSESEPVRSESPHDVVRDLTRRAGERRRGRPAPEEDARVHLNVLAAALEELTPSRRRREQWRDQVAAEPLIRDRLQDDEAIEPLAQHGARR
jgi:hypothetical protein